MDLYPSVEEKAAMLLYLVTKNHSFSDGNKRIAATLFLWFMNVFVKPDEQSQACLNSAMARKGARKRMSVFSKEEQDASQAFFYVGKCRKDISAFLVTVFASYFPAGESFVYKKMSGEKEASRRGLRKTINQQIVYMNNIRIDLLGSLISPLRMNL